jgi:dTDP-4-amino-4,6-dideoxygalactose transaminase
MDKIDHLLKARKDIADFYFEELKHAPGITLPIPDLPGRKRVWYAYCIMVKKEELGIDRDALMARLAEKGIGTGVHFEALSTQPYYQERFGYKAGMFPEAEYVSERTLSLPLSANMTEEDAMYVAETLKSILKRGR